jgi:preprotein translocase subunit SecG
MYCINRKIVNALNVNKQLKHVFIKKVNFMIKILLFVHLVVALLLVGVILLQKTSADGLTGISSGSGNNLGIVNIRSSANFMSKLTMVLAAMFFMNALIIGNLSTKLEDRILHEIEQQDRSIELDLESGPQRSLPVAK